MTDPVAMAIACVSVLISLATIVMHVLTERRYPENERARVDYECKEVA